jgi:uncharacterized membrane protein YdjX (TVP38/TMEM64 family)
MIDWLTALLLRVTELGPWGPVLFVAIYIVAALVIAPAIVLTLAAGALYGVWWGSLLVFVSATLGAIAAYAVAVRLSRLRLLGWMDRNPRVVAVRLAVAGEGPWIQFLLRLSPVVPFTWLNYALGLSRVPFRDFVVALVGMIPAIFLYTYYGMVVGDVAKLAAGVAPPRGPAYYVLLVVGLITTIVATTSIARAAGRAIEQQRARR